MYPYVTLCRISVLERSGEYFCLYNSWATLAAEVHVGGSFFGGRGKEKEGEGAIRLCCMAC